MKRGIALFVVVLLSCSIAASQPAKSSMRGKPLEEWMKSYWTWALGGDQASSEKGIVFLPLPQGERSVEDPRIFVGELDVTLRPGQGFALPVFVYVGETYLEAGIPDDDPAFPPPEFFAGAEVRVALDGKTIIDSADGNLEGFYFDAQFFEDPLLYDELPEYAPDVHALGAIWVKGIGFVHGPLSVGEHTLELFVFSDDVNSGYANTWNITVAKE